MSDPWNAFQNPTTVSRRVRVGVWGAPFTYAGQEKAAAEKEDANGLTKDKKKKKDGDGFTPNVFVVLAISATLYGLAGLGALTLWRRR
jgi:hypothetical protein